MSLSVNQDNRYTGFAGTVTPHLWIIVYQHLIASNAHIFTGQYQHKIVEQIAQLYY